MSQYNITSKYGKGTRQLKFKKELKTPGSIKKATKYAWKYFKLKTWKIYFDTLSISVSQSKTKEVETKLSVHSNIRFLLTK